MALTGIVFSLMFLIVQFSALSYSPRLTKWIARDPILYHAAGTFTATFVYAVAALAWVARSGSNKVPRVSEHLVITLLLTSVAMFIVLIYRVGNLSIGRMLLFTSNQGRKAIETMYPPLEPSVAAIEAKEVLGLSLTQTLSITGSRRRFKLSM